MNKRWLLIVVLILLAHAVSGLTITPLSATISTPEIGKEYPFIITVINDEDTDIDVELNVGQDSYYLVDDVTIRPSKFALAPHEKMNVEVSLIIPSDITPEEHNLLITPLAAGKMWDSFEIYFLVPGIQNHNLTISKVTAQDTTTDKTTYIQIQMVNNGNVIARAIPTINILKDNTIIDTIIGKGKFLVMPGQTYNVSILYDPAILARGRYEAEVILDYNGWRKTNSLRDGFEVSKYDLSNTDSIEQKSILQGEALSLELTLKRDQPTSYNSIAVIEGTNIHDEITGQLLASTEQIKTFNLETEFLEPGDYIIQITTSYGDGQQTSVNMALKVKSKTSRTVQYALLATVIALIIGLSVKRFILANPDNKDKKRLIKQISRLEKRYSRLEIEAKHLISGVETYIADSNRWLNKHYPNQYEFK